MVDTQVRPSDVTKFPIIEALLAVPREEFVPSDKREAAYIGEHIDMGDGRVLLAPMTFAKMLDAVNVGPKDVVLDIGCGLGYSSAILARMAEFVVGVEVDGKQADEAQQNLSTHGIDNAAVVEAPLFEGAAKSGPYDVIILQGAIETLPPSIEAQLKESGRIIALFAQGALGEVRIGKKIDGVMNWRLVFNANAPVLPGFEHELDFTF